MFSAACHLLRLQLNETRSVETMRDIRAAQTWFRAHRGRYGTLNELTAMRLIRSELATGYYSGYFYSIEAETQHYRAKAVPKKFGNDRDIAGLSGKFLDETGVIRRSWSDVKNLGVTDEPMEP